MSIPIRQQSPEEAHAFKEWKKQSRHDWEEEMKRLRDTLQIIRYLRKIEPPKHPPLRRLWDRMIKADAREVLLGNGTGHSRR